MSDYNPTVLNVVAAANNVGYLKNQGSKSFWGVTYLQL